MASKNPLRIVGVVKNNINNTSKSYLILNENTLHAKVMSMDIVMTLAAKGEIKNARCITGDLEMTECSESRLPLYYPTLEPISYRNAIFIINKICINDSKVGFRIVRYASGHVRAAYISEEELIQRIEKIGTISLINGKLCTRGDKKYISAIKGNFEEIRISGFDTKISEYTAHEEQVYEKIRKSLIDEESRRFLLDMVKDSVYNIPFAVSTDRLMLRIMQPIPSKKTLFAVCSGSLEAEMCNSINKKTYEKILDLEELAQEVKNTKIKPNSELERTFNNVVNELMPQPQYRRIRIGDHFTFEQWLYIVHIGQFYCTKGYYQQCIHKAMNMTRLTTERVKDKPRYYSDKELQKIISISLLALSKKASRCATKQFQDFIAEFREVINTEFKSKKPKDLCELAFTLKSFRTEKEMQQVGFSLESSNDGKEIIAHDNSYKKIIYLGKYVDKFENYKKEIRCLGDACAIAYISKILKAYFDRTIKLRRVLIIQYIEIIAIIAYMYDSTATKLFLENNQKILASIGVTLPNWENTREMAKTLGDDERIYFESGFTIAKDNRGRDFYINYRDRAISTAANFTSSELISGIVTVSSPRCTEDTIRKLIVRLRFI